MLENIERNSVLVAAIEKYMSNWASPEVSNYVLQVDHKIVSFFNPTLVNVDTPTSKYLMSSLLSAGSTAVFYIVSVFLLAIVVWMLNPKPYIPKKPRTSLKEKFTQEPLQFFAMLYNLVQVIACGYMAYRALEVVINDNYELVCQEHNVNSERMAKVHWLFYMSKILDFMDTYMIVLRRKWRQLSFLHVYHHFSVFLFQWLYNRAGYDGDIWFVIFANVSVHCVMYFYYFLKTIDVQVPIFFKKMITNLQLFQFTCMMIQAVYVYYNNCAYPKRLLVLYFFYIASLFFLFMNFFIVNYLSRKAEMQKKKKKQ